MPQIENRLITFVQTIGMTKTNWYTDWFNSPFYHRLYFERNEKKAEAFIHEVIKHLSPPPGSLVLDTACRKGQFMQNTGRIEL